MAVQVGERLPLIVSGRVIDELGKPVDHVRVSVRCSGPRTGASQPWIATRQVTTSSSGQFELRGADTPDSLVLSASKLGYSDSEASLAAPGEGRAELVLRRGGVVAGRVLVDQEIRLDSMRLSLDARFKGGNHDLSLPSFEWGLRPSADGGFSFEEVGARQVRLSVLVEGEHVMDIGDIPVGVAGTPPDPRLDPLDLRGRFQLLTIELQDDVGRILPSGTVVLRDPMMPRTRMIQGGKARFLVSHGSYDFDIEAPGWRRERLSAVSTDRNANAERGLNLPSLPRRAGILESGKHGCLGAPRTYNAESGPRP